MPNYYEQFMEICHKKIDNMSFSDYINCVCKFLILYFNHTPISAFYETCNSLDTIRELYEKKETIYNCCIEVGLDHLVG